MGIENEKNKMFSKEKKIYKEFENFAKEAEIEKEEKIRKRIRSIAEERERKRILRSLIEEISKIPPEKYEDFKKKIKEWRESHPAD